jgi:mRNA-degrading endonuclease toxin of MazEF toxin-antitoxin module
MLIVDPEPVLGHEQGGQRRALVVSYEPFHASGLVTVVPVTAARSEARHAQEIPIAAGEAGQTKPGVVLCQHVRTISLHRAEAMLRARQTVGYLTDPALRTSVRNALAIQLGLDVPGSEDGASEDDAYGP